jgi:hypothetical protein
MDDADGDRDCSERNCAKRSGARDFAGCRPVRDWPSDARRSEYTVFAARGTAAVVMRSLLRNPIEY